jgi:excisionase family DNA binding protein
VTYTVKSLATHLQCDQQMIYDLLSSGKLRGWRLGGRLWRIDQEAVDEYKRNQTTGSTGSRGSSASSGRKAENATAIALARATQKRRGRHSESSYTSVPAYNASTEFKP